MDYFSLLKNTNAYKMFSGDKARGTLSHANLIVCEDEANLEAYLKIFAKTLMCNESEPCLECRACRLIDSKTHTDVVFYPQGKKIVVSDVDDLIEKSYFRPLESDKKVFVLTGVSSMTVQAQNKLLKTLEEPPKNTYLILGTTSVYPLLSTVLSRCKRFDIPPFSEDDVLALLKESYTLSDKLKTAVRLSGGKIGEAISRYESGAGNLAEETAIKIFTELKSSKDVAKYSSLVTKDILGDFISSSVKLIETALRISLNKQTTGEGRLYEGAKKLSETASVGALLYTADKLREIEKDYYFNGNLTALTDGLLFGILEGKHKWSK